MLQNELAVLQIQRPAFQSLGLLSTALIFFLFFIFYGKGEASHVSPDFCMNCGKETPVGGVWRTSDNPAVGQTDVLDATLTLSYTTHTNGALSS